LIPASPLHILVAVLEQEAAFMDFAHSLPSLHP
jgi:hypothetical protein